MVLVVLTVIPVAGISFAASSAIHIAGLDNPDAPLQGHGGGGAESGGSG